MSVSDFDSSYNVSAKMLSKFKMLGLLATSRRVVECCKDLRKVMSCRELSRVTRRASR